MVASSDDRLRLQVVREFRCCEPYAGRYQSLGANTAAFFLALVPQLLDLAAGNLALQFAVLGFASIVLNTMADVVVAFAAGDIRAGATARPNLIRRLRDHGVRLGAATHGPRGYHQESWTHQSGTRHCPYSLVRRECSRSGSDAWPPMVGKWHT
jgi:hypothetical protein